MAASHAEFFRKHYPELSQRKIPGNGMGDIYSNLGMITHSPQFIVAPEHNAESLTFEIGVNPIMIPFAQADVKITPFEIPQQVWNVMKPGQYFGRILDSMHQSIAQWKWKKP